MSVNIVKKLFIAFEVDQNIASVVIDVTVNCCVYCCY